MALHQLRGDQGHPRIAHEIPQCLDHIEPECLRSSLFCQTIPFHLTGKVGPPATLCPEIEHSLYLSPGIWSLPSGALRAVGMKKLCVSRKVGILKAARGARHQPTMKRWL